MIRKRVTFVCYFNASSLLLLRYLSAITLPPQDSLHITTPYPLRILSVSSPYPLCIPLMSILLFPLLGVCFYFFPFFLLILSRPTPHTYSSESLSLYSLKSFSLQRYGKYLIFPTFPHKKIIYNFFYKLSTFYTPAILLILCIVYTLFTKWGKIKIYRTNHKGLGILFHNTHQPLISHLYPYHYPSTTLALMTLIWVLKGFYSVFCPYVVDHFYKNTSICAADLYI